MSYDLLLGLKREVRRLKEQSEFVDVSEELHRVKRAMLYLRSRLAN